VDGKQEGTKPKHPKDISRKHFTLILLLTFPSTPKKRKERTKQQLAASLFKILLKKKFTKKSLPYLPIKHFSDYLLELFLLLIPVAPHGLSSEGWFAGWRTCGSGLHCHNSYLPKCEPYCCYLPAAGCSCDVAGGGWQDTKLPNNQFFLLLIRVLKPYPTTAPMLQIFLI